MKKRTLGFKLTFGGIMLVLIPIVVIGGFALYKATGALDDMARGQAVQITKNMSDMVEVAIKEEMKIAASLSVQPHIIEAAAKVSHVGAEKAAETDRISAELVKITKQTGNDYEALFVADDKGVIFADNNGKTRGISVADRDYIRESKAGKVNLGAVIKSRATGKPCAPIGAPIY